MAYVIIHGRGLSGPGLTGLGAVARVTASPPPVQLNTKTGLPGLPVSIKVPGPFKPNVTVLVPAPSTPSKGISGGTIAAIGLGVLAVVVVASRMGG